MSSEKNEGSNPSKNEPSENKEIDIKIDSGEIWIGSDGDINIDKVRGGEIIIKGGDFSEQGSSEGNSDFTDRIGPMRNKESDE